jgi:flagellar protein FliO/FliZ
MDMIDIARMAFALLAVLALIGLLGLAAKRVGLSSGAPGLARKRRLALVETLPLDQRRRAAIIRCDGREHLVLIGANSETLIAADIATVKPADFASEFAATAAPTDDPAPRRMQARIAAEWRDAINADAA